MKKVLIGLICILIMVFLYMYQLPIISSGEAVTYAENILENPPEEWSRSIKYNEGTWENINTNLIAKSGFFNKITNKREWEVTIKTVESEYTIVIDAYSGEFIDLFGAFN